MALSAKLQFGDNELGHYSSEFMVVSCECKLVRHHNQNCPDADSKCDHVVVVVVSPGNENHELVEWYISHGCRSGRILFDVSDLGGTQSDDTTMELVFEDAVCCSLSENYDIDSMRRREYTIEFFGRSTTIGNVNFN